MNSHNRLRGLCIKSTPLGENDRLITVLSDEQGIIRLAAPGARTVSYTHLRAHETDS